ncbi:MAG: SH3 domain-containing protein [Chloroflexi bacterium]|nr:SH3 domain-containing protein [Chloroflexota bacterium]
MYESDDAEAPDVNAPPSIDMPETFTSKRATSTITAPAVPPSEAGGDEFDDDGDDSFLAAFDREEPAPFTPVTGLGEGMDWAREFTADQAEREAAAEIDAFFQDIAPGTGQPRVDDAPQGDFGAASPFGGQFDDLDTYLDSLDADAPQVSQQTNVVFNRPDAMDIDALLNQQIAAAREKRPGYVAPFEIDSDDIEAADLNFLEGMGASVDEVSAAAIVRQRQDRPEEELPERLRKLRKRAGQKKSDDDSAADDSLTEMLPGVSAGLTATYVGRGQEPERKEREGDQGQQITSEQRTRADLLRNLAGVAAAPKRMSAIEMTYDSPFMQDIESDEEIILHPQTQTQEAQVAPVVRRRRRTGLRIQPDRLLIVLLLAAAVISPFLVPGLRLGDPPPVDFTRDRLALTGFVTIDRLAEGDLALVALEYNPASAGELDVLTGAILRHILLRGATPVVISGNPLALLRAETQFADINADAEFLERINVQQPLEQNYEYALARYLPGGMIGLRAFSADTAAMLASDLRGQTSSLYIQGLNDFALMVVVTDSGETLRDYAEQIAPYSRAHVVGASTYAAAPLAEPYARSEAISGLLVGFGDGLTYEGLLPGVAAVEREARIVRTPPPTPEPGSEQGSLAGSVEVTPVPAEATPEPTPETTPPPLVAIVTANQRVNVRAEPNGTIIGGADPGTRVFLLGSNEDGTWANVRLEEGAEGWISTSLLTLATPEPRPKARRGSDSREQDVDVPMTNTRPPSRATEEGSPTPSPSPSATPSATRTVRPTTTPAAEAEATEEAGAAAEASPTRRPTAEASATPSATPEPSATPTVTVTPTSTETEIPTETPLPPTPAPLTFSAGLRDERWYGINMGIIASVLIIGGGAMANIGRAIVRGRRRRDR